MKGVYRKESGTRWLLANENKVTFPQREGQGVLGGLAHLPLGDGEGPGDRLPPWC